MTNKDNISIEQLTPLKDFPDYYINLENGDVYSYLKRTGWAATKEKVLRKINGKLQGRNKRNLQRMFTMTDKKGKKRYVMHGRLMIAASRGISYYIIPDDISCNYLNGEIVMRNRSEVAKQAWEDKLREHNIDVLNKIDNRLYTLQLLQKAYLGNRKPLLEYVYEHMRMYAYRVMEKVHWKLRTAYEAVKLAIDRLLNVIDGKHVADIIILDKWIVNTAIGLQRIAHPRGILENN